MASSFTEKNPSVKYNKLNTFTYELESEEPVKKDTKQGMFFSSTGKYTRVTIIALSVLAVVGITAYALLSDTAKNSTEKDNEDTPNRKISVRAAQCTAAENSRYDCWPERTGVSEAACLSRGCCWKEATVVDTAPYCFFQDNYDGYTASDVKVTASGVTATLTRTTNSFVPKDVKTLKLVVEYQTSYRLRFRIYDPNNARFEVPLVTPSGSQNVDNKLYTVTVQEKPFNIVIKRTSTGAIVFDTTNAAPLIFADQFLQIGTVLSTKYLYGLGEHRATFLQDVTRWRRLPFWTRDDVPKVDNNGYGVHPFFLNLETGGTASNSNAHGVFLLNSNGGEVAIQPTSDNKAGAITYRFLGGILDFYVFLGPAPLSIVSQYAEVVGQPYFPPFWSLGYHLCKWGYDNNAKLRDVINRNRQARIPYDVQWNDIDYMQDHRDWTYDKTRFSDLPSIVKDLHDNHQRYVIMADPAISSTQPAGSYHPYDDGVQMDIFVKDASGKILIGEVWPGKTAFPDFFHPRAVEYWLKQAKEFHAQVPFDGLWIDMNEPSNFVDGSSNGCTTNSLDNPPFTPATLDGGSLRSKTICPSAKHAISTHYNLHNMYGWSQANVSRRALDILYGGNKRSPIITRSSFAGSGKNVGHWLGDNSANFNELYYSIPGILNFNLFGVPQIGADICGFLGDTTPELCTRWHQVAAFYPFMRNHAVTGSRDQDPAAFQAPFVDYIRTAIELRYRLLAVLYTAFYKAHTQGLPIVRPLFYLYPGTEAIDKQFMWNDQLLVSPVLTQGATTVHAFLPNDVFYDFYTGAGVAQKGQTVQLNAPIDQVNLHVRGGSILPMLPVTQRSDLSRQEKFQLLVAVGSSGGASGELFWDDGESSDSVSGNKYTDIAFTLTGSNHLVSTVSKGGYKPTGGIKLGSVTFYGIIKAPGSVSVNGKTATINYDAALKVLHVNNLDVDLLTPLSVQLN